MSNAIFVLGADENLTRRIYRTLYRPELPVKGMFLRLKEGGFTVKKVDAKLNAAFGTAPLAEIERLLALPNTLWRLMAASDPNATVWFD